MLIQEDNAGGEIDDTARRALSKITELGLPLTPEIFAVWHGYCSGNFPAVNQFIDRKCGAGHTLSETEIEDLHFRYFTDQSSSETLITAGNSFDNLVSDTLTRLSGTASHTSDYASALSEFQNKLEGDDTERATSAVAEIIEKTSAIRQEQAELCSDLNEAANSITTLRADLEESEAAACRDEITQVSNWLAIHKELRLQAISSTENNEPLSIAIIDIDGFSNFNAQYGRPVGNSALSLLASIIRDLVGDRGAPGRYGADEFIVVMPAASKNDAAVLTEELRQKIEARQLRNKRTEETYGAVTISAAVGEYEIGEALAGFLKRTVDALDGAKKDGGNKIAFASTQNTMTSDGSSRASRRAFG